ncbi:BolA family protein [Salinarimonas sp.]|uniref:BolA family protein n=1 Tax=Salinarimonas sp. TaxID=2766526 RepID=UPI00391BFC1B
MSETTAARLPMKDLIEARLTEALRPTRLVVTDESHLHAGHAGWREGGETHFRVDVVSPAFSGKTRVEAHRLVNAALAEAFARGLHALAVKAEAPTG